MAVVGFLGCLVAGHPDAIDVDDDDEIARVHVRRENRLVLAPQATGDFHRHAAEHLVGGVDHVPVVLDFLGLGGEGFHHGNVEAMPETESGGV